MGCIKSKPGLAKKDLAFLKANTNYDEKAVKVWYKSFMHDCPNGRLTPEIFIEMYELFFPGGNSQRFCDHVFENFDTDKKGHLDFKEFLLAIDMTNAETAEEKLKVAFKMYDLDGSGELEIDEVIKIVEDVFTMQRVYSKLGAGTSKPRKSAEETAKDIFSTIDENGDGHLTEEEFLRGCLKDDKLCKMLMPNIIQ